MLYYKALTIAYYRSIELFNIAWDLFLYWEYKVGLGWRKGRYDNNVGSYMEWMWCSKVVREVNILDLYDLLSDGYLYIYVLLDLLLNIDKELLLFTSCLLLILTFDVLDVLLLFILLVFVLIEGYLKSFYKSIWSIRFWLFLLLLILLLCI